MNRFKALFVVSSLACAGTLGCAQGSSPADAGGDAGPDAGADAGIDAGPTAPAASWSYAWEAALFTRGLDVSCAPADADAGVEGCIALLRYRGELDEPDHPTDSSGSAYGAVRFIRTDAAGHVTWRRTLMNGYAWITLGTGAFVDDDLRVRLLANGEFLVSGTYEGRVFIGTPGGNNQELGPSANRNLFTIEFHADGTFDNWEDTGNGNELHARAAVELPSTDLVIAGSCQGDVPLDNGASFPCAAGGDGYLLTVHYDASTVGGVTLGASHGAEVADLAADASGNLYASGTFGESMKFGSLPEDVATGDDDGFLLKLDPSGARSFITFAGSLGQDRGGRLALVPGGVLWTSLVSRGARVGREFFAEGGHVVAKVDPTGAVLWARRVPGAHPTAPLGVAAASDGSFALYGDGFLGRFAADGTPSWQHLDADVRGASFTKDSLVVIATAIGTKALGVTLAAWGDEVVRTALIAFPR